MKKRIPVRLDGEGIILDPCYGNDPDTTIEVDRDEVIIELFNHGEHTGMSLTFNQLELLEVIK